MLHKDCRHRWNAQCSGPLAGCWCLCYIVVGPAGRPGPWCRSGVVKQRLNSLARMPKSCLVETRHRSSPVQYHPSSEAWRWQHHAVGMFFSGRNWETRERGKDECSNVQRHPWQKPVAELSGPQTGLKVHLPKGNNPKHTARWQSTKEWLPDFSVNVLEWEPKPDWTSLERSENNGQPDGAWEVLHRRIGETAKKCVCQDWSIILKKTWGCNCCQRYYNKVMSKDCEYLCYIFFCKSIKNMKLTFFPTLSLWGIVCRIEETN